MNIFNRNRLVKKIETERRLHLNFPFNFLNKAQIVVDVHFRVLNEQSKEKPVATTQSTYLQPSVRTAGGGPGGAGHGTGHAQFHRGAPPTQTTAQSAVGDPYAKHMLQVKYNHI